jgi:hypothetical protein
LGGAGPAGRPHQQKNMDLQLYYKKIRETEQGLNGPSVVVISLATPDGGREGVRTEVARRIAAKMLVEGVVRLATPEEAGEFQEQKAEAKRQADQLSAASRMQFAVISPSELRKLKGTGQTGRD